MTEYEIIKGDEINQSRLEEHRMFQGLKKHEWYVLKHSFSIHDRARTEIVYHAPTKEKCEEWYLRKG